MTFHKMNDGQCSRFSEAMGTVNAADDAAYFVICTRNNDPCMRKPYACHDQASGPVVLSGIVAAAHVPQLLGLRPYHEMVQRIGASYVCP